MPRGRSFWLAHAAEQRVHIGPEPLPLHVFLVRQPREGVPGVDARKVAGGLTVPHGLRAPLGRVPKSWNCCFGSGKSSSRPQAVYSG